MAKKDTIQKEHEERLKRALADYQNLEKRVGQERLAWIKTANKELILRILPILDTLVLAGKHLQDGGLTASIKQFEDVLKSEGVEKIETMGQEFNPQIMECVVTEQVDPSAASGQGEGKVLDELQAGYMLYDKVLRPAKVKVGKNI